MTTTTMRLVASLATLLALLPSSRGFSVVPPSGRNVAFRSFGVKNERARAPLAMAANGETAQESSGPLEVSW